MLFDVWRIKYFLFCELFNCMRPCSNASNIWKDIYNLILHFWIICIKYSVIDVNTSDFCVGHTYHLPVSNEAVLLSLSISQSAFIFIRRFPLDISACANEHVTFQRATTLDPVHTFVRCWLILFILKPVWYMRESIVINFTYFWNWMKNELWHIFLKSRS